MPRACSPEKAFKAAACILVLLAQGCTKAPSSGLKCGDWIIMMMEKADITSTQDTTPYYVNIPETSLYYDAVQSAVSWGVLDPDEPFDPMQELDKDTAAYTVINLSGMDLTQPDHSIKDISKCRYPQQVSRAVNSGFMKLDKRGLFHPKDPVTHEDAELLLASAIDWMNHRTFDIAETDITWNEDADWIEEEPLVFDEENETAVFEEGTELEPGSIFTAKDAYGFDGYYTVDSVQTASPHTGTEQPEGNRQNPDGSEISGSFSYSSETAAPIDGENTQPYFRTQEPVPEPEADPGQLIVKFHPSELGEIIEDLHMQNTTELDFTDAVFINPVTGEVMDDGSTSSMDTPGISHMANREKLGTDTYNLEFPEGWKLKIKKGAGTISAAGIKTMPNGTEYSVELGVSSSATTYKFNVEHFKLKEGYLRVDFDSYQKIKVEHEASKKLYGPLDKGMDPTEFLNVFKKKWVPAVDSKEFSIPIATVKVPVPNAPMVLIDLSLDLTLSADGKIELSANQTNSYGMEVKDGVLHKIQESDRSAKTVLHANAQALLGVGAGIDIVNAKLGDVRAEAGIGCEMDTTVHMYDKEGNHIVEKTAIPADVTAEMAEGKGDVFVCADAKAYWLGRLVVNSEKTMAGKLGLSGKTEFGGEKYPVSDKLHAHYENWISLPSCTRKDRSKVTEALTRVETDTIEVKDSLIMGTPGSAKTIEITGLPKDITIKDVKFITDNPLVATVSENGTVLMLKEGSAIITLIASKHKEDTVLQREAFTCKVMVNVRKGDKS